ncbi:hypothetical protein TrLO_g15128 [Triparma laevis f. longispina]|uniref:Uncharacterized protein n=1 Tax=Triparma laevis f. longispina TaxID=1714387 RepID=A0A9W7F887_9STRA|nr:hypothetical protein TrLO_g15128 [Triparma laevis f. longispina]
MYTTVLLLFLLLSISTITSFTLPPPSSFIRSQSHLSSTTSSSSSSSSSSPLLTSYTYTLLLPNKIPLITFPGNAVPPVLTEWFDNVIASSDSMKDSIKEGSNLTLQSPKDFVTDPLWSSLLSSTSTIHLTITTSPLPPLSPPTSPSALESDVAASASFPSLFSNPQTLTDLESDPSQITKPRTPQSIKAAYDQKIETGQVSIQAPGWGGFFDRIKGGYFFGFFEAFEDQIRNPEKKNTNSWLLRPSITFPLAFAVVGLAFAVMVEGGGIRERGEVRRDELDEVVLQGTEERKEEDSTSGWFN